MRWTKLIKCEQNARNMFWTYIIIEINIWGQTYTAFIACDHNTTKIPWICCNFTNIIQNSGMPPPLPFFHLHPNMILVHLVFFLVYFKLNFRTALISESSIKNIFYYLLWIFMFKWRHLKSVFYLVEFTKVNDQSLRLTGYIMSASAMNFQVKGMKLMDRYHHCKYW